MSYDNWKLRSPDDDRGYYEDDPEEDERVGWEDMEMLSEDDDEFFIGWWNFQDTVWPVPV